MSQGTENLTSDTVLDVTEERIARVYAQALLDAAGDSSESCVEELEAFCTEVLGKHAMFEQMLSSAFVDHERRASLLDRILGGKVSDLTLNTLKVLSEKGRIGIARSVALQARKLWNEVCRRADVLVRVASPIDDATLERIKETIRAQRGVEPIVRVEIDPSLVGGLELRIGDTVYDGTIRTAFAKAHKEIVVKTVEAIETNPERFTLAS